jgi:AcrR family transcriptional regulator
MDSKTRILVTAERRIALDGTATVSLNKILQDAGQRNRSAILYHFGSREALIDSILVFRVPEIERIQRALAERIGFPDSDLASVKEIIHIFILTFQEYIKIHGSESYYLRFLHALLYHSRFRSVIFYNNHAEAPFGLELNRALARKLESVPPHFAEYRVISTLVQLVSGLALIEGDFSLGNCQIEDWRTSDLLDTLSASFLAVPSTRTLALIDDDSDEFALAQRSLRIHGSDS